MVARDHRVGDPWRRRWDSLRLFTPAFYNGLPGSPFPADDPDHLPTRLEVASYLEDYARENELPIQLETEVRSLRRDNGTYIAETDRGPIRSDRVVVATGAFQTPRLPDFAPSLDPDVFSLHSSDYLRPSQLPDGDVLVVGSGNSGMQIATELAERSDGRTVWLSGREPGVLPRTLFGRDIYHSIGPTVLRARRGTSFGWLVRRLNRRGDPVFGPTHRALKRTRVVRVPRTAGIRDGRPVLAGGRVLEPRTVIWCTGFGNRYPWVDLDAFTPRGRPAHHRGVSTRLAGLFFVGIEWLYRLRSPLLGGVGEDAAYIADRIAGAANT